MASSSTSQKKISAQTLTLSASHVAYTHTVLASTAFATALFLACVLHYKKIVKNDVARWPEEWWPSVSATVGDWYPERNVFQILIALTSGPRISLVILQYLLSSQSTLPRFVFVFGLLRTLACGGWVYITSNDDHDVHDMLMITYMVCNLPWMLGGIACTPPTNREALKRRRLIATAFFGSIVPMVYFYIQHKVYRIPGAYTRYSFFEWSLIIFDIMYDSVAELDFKHANLQITVESSTGYRKEPTPEVALKPPKDLSSTKSSEGDVNVPKLSADKAASAEPSPSKDHQIKFGLPDQWRSTTSFVSDVFLSYIFWSIFTSLVPTLFYFSVWELSIAGAELALLSTLSPIVLSIPPLFSWARTRGGRTTLHLLSFSGLAAYALDRPVHRLLIVTFATAIVVVRQVVDWTGTDANDSGYQSTLTGLGLILSSLSKHANHSNNPVWPMVNAESGGYNKSGLFLALLALCEMHTRPDNIRDGRTSGYAVAPTAVNSKRNKDRHWLIPALSLGSLIFSLHCFLSDSSTLIAWSWSGYENRLPRGPQPNLHGALTLIAQCLGLLISVSLGPRHRDILVHPVWFLYGAFSSFVMYQYKGWLGYGGGLNFAIFLMSIIPPVFEGAAVYSRGTVARMYFTAFFTTCLLDLANVWTVAYAFVPGGNYLRERSDLVLMIEMACISLAFNWPRMKKIESSLRIKNTVRFQMQALVALLSVLSVLVTLYRLPVSPPQPYHAGDRLLTAGIWTLHFGMDNEGRDSQRRVRDLIHDMTLDVVGLLETDLHRIAYGNRDLTRVLTEDLGYYADLGPGPNSHTWGAALLSKFPIINTTHHLLPSPRGELAPAIEGWLDVYGTEVLVVIAHNGQEEDPLDRELQSRELARIMNKAYPNPTVFLGYVVTKPFATRPAPYDFLVTDGWMHDVDEDDLDRWCEYIFYRGLYRTVYARVSRGVVTDTELQVAQFVLPKHGSSVVDETREARTLRSFKEDLPEVHWFPMEYYGDESGGGKNSHFYHVFYS